MIDLSTDTLLFQGKKMMCYLVLTILCLWAGTLFALTEENLSDRQDEIWLSPSSQISYTETSQNADLALVTDTEEQRGLKAWEHSFENHQDFDKWYWTSFPVLDTVSVKGCRAYNVFEELFHTHFSDNFEFLPTYLGEILWVDTGRLDRIQWMMNDWTPQHDYHTVTYPQGYKIHIRPRISSDYPSKFAVHLEGFAAPNDLKFPIYGGTENWLGYYLENSQMPEKALGSIWDDVLVAKTKNWCLIRSRESEEMLGTSSPLNFGDMLVLVTMNNHNFKWNRYHPDAAVRNHDVSFFLHNEEQDYLPLYISIPDRLRNDIDEISLYVRGVCKGATVVDSSAEQISAYINNPNELLEGKIELGFYSANSKADDKLGYLILTQERLQAKYGAAGKRYPYFEVKLTDQDINKILPPKFTLEQNYPNPFNPTTTISYQLKEPGKVNLDIYNLRGQLVKSLVVESQEAGYHSIIWNGKDNKNRSVASGVYLYRLKCGNNVQTKRMLLIK